MVKLKCAIAILVALNASGCIRTERYAGGSEDANATVAFYQSEPSAGSQAVLDLGTTALMGALLLAGIAAISSVQ